MRYCTPFVFYLTISLQTMNNMPTCSSRFCLTLTADVGLNVTCTQKGRHQVCFWSGRERREDSERPDAYLAVDTCGCICLILISFVMRRIKSRLSLAPSALPFTWHIRRLRLRPYRGECTPSGMISLFRSHLQSRLANRLPDRAAAVLMIRLVSRIRPPIPRVALEV